MLDNMNENFKSSTFNKNTINNNQSTVPAGIQLDQTMNSATTAPKVAIIPKHKSAQKALSSIRFS